MERKQEGRTSLTLGCHTSQELKDPAWSCYPRRPAILPAAQSTSSMGTGSGCYAPRRSGPFPSFGASSLPGPLMAGGTTPASCSPLGFWGRGRQVVLRPRYSQQPVCLEQRDYYQISVSHPLIRRNPNAS